MKNEKCNKCCRTCDNQKSIVVTSEKSTRKRILKQNRVMQSLYTRNISALNNTINNKNEGLKHNSYKRYLNKKVGKTLSRLNEVKSLTRYNCKWKNC
tara:strand:+ start:551 stop:841 length:291 start_codon:yes stop_codon:yes gene_type:complete